MSCFALGLVVLFTSAAKLAAQPSPCATPAHQPGDVSVQLSLQNGQTAFREGEIISLIAEYSSSTEKTYYLSTRNYDRSGRLNGAEEFCLDPASGKDPLSDYFNGAMAFMGGGLSTELDLGAKPFSTTLELNEWKSLPPGSYRLTIVGHRVTIPSENHRPGYAPEPIPLRSNEVAFQVVKADPDWQAAQLVAATNALDAGGEDAKHAARVLRFLGSEAAAQELARRFWSGIDQPFGWELKFGLFGAPDRSAAIEAMQAALKDPQHPVTREFVQALSVMEMQSDAKSRLPEYDPNHREAWEKTAQDYSTGLDKRIAEHMAQAAAALSSKTGKARAVTAGEVLEADVALNPVAKTQLRQMLLASWESMPIQRRNELIQYRWDQVGGPEWVPVLRNIVAGEPGNHQVDRLDRGSALRHLYEIAPDQGRELILREIGDPQSDIGIRTLGLLPERELPQIEQSLVARLKSHSGSDVEYQLIERYASARVLPDIKAIYDAHRGEWACAPQTAMLRYFLRVSPDYGMEQVSDALTHRKTTGCYTQQLAELHEDLRRPKLEAIAIRALDDSSPEVAANAAAALGKFGSSKTEPALWARLERFHEQWKDKAADLEYRPGITNDLQQQISLEQVLVPAIASGQAWYTNGAGIHRLKDLASPQMQSALDGMLQEIENGEYGLNLNWWPEGVLNYTVGRYNGNTIPALKEKLSQFPAGTHLSMITTVAERERHRAEFAEVESAAAASGLLLDVQTPR